MEDYISEPNAFDMGISTIMRMNYWLWKCNDCQYNNDIDGWFKSMIILYKETDPFMKEKEQEEHQKYHKESETSYKKHLQYIHEFNVNKQRNIQQPFNPPREIFDLLFDWEIKLRRVLDRTGLLMRKGEDAGATITRM